MKSLKLFILFLIINFGGLYIGNILMNNGPNTDWYINLNKAPWTPPGWVFGVAWTVIMVCFSLWCAKAFEQINSNKLTIAFVVSFILNVSWNYAFFNQHLTTLGLVILIGLLIAILYLAANIKPKPNLLLLLMLPYIIWLCIATSLNLYIIVHN